MKGYVYVKACLMLLIDTIVIYACRDSVLRVIYNFWIS